MKFNVSADPISKIKYTYMQKNKILKKYRKDMELNKSSFITLSPKDDETFLMYIMIM